MSDAALPGRWRVLVEAAPRPGAEQMARDEGLLALAAATGAPHLRLYAWRPACVSLGAHESAVRRFDPAAFAARGLDTVRRPTGGRAVLHRDDLTYAVAVPATHAAAADPAALLASVHARFATAVGALGGRAIAAPRRRAPAPDGGGICFDAAVGGELLLVGEDGGAIGKVLGSAQRRTTAGVLQHGSLLLHDDQTMLLACTRDREAEITPASSTGVATLTGALGRDVTWREAADALLAAWTADDGPLAPVDGAALDAAAAPHRSRYADPAWTWRR